MKLVVIVTVFLFLIVVNAFQPTTVQKRTQTSTPPVTAMIRSMSTTNQDPESNLESYQSKLPSNIADETSQSSVDDNNEQHQLLGTRGEIYVAMQAVLNLGIGFGGLPLVTGTLKTLFGPVCLLLGVILLMAGTLEMGNALSPFPVPDDDKIAETGLVTTGIFSYIRHPLYTGTLVAGLGWSVVTDSALRMLFVFLAALFYTIKTDFEEAKLLEIFPDEYHDYQERTGKFLPKNLEDRLFLK